MDAAGPWQPIGIALAMSEPNGPVEHAFFIELRDMIAQRLRAAMPLDGVYFCAHGAAVTTEDDDPEGALFEIVRGIVGPGVPVVATFDLHANVSDRMVDLIDAFIGYRTNPHLDMRERGAEAAAALRELLAPARTTRVRLRLPIVPPTVTMLTAAGPYADMINFSQQRMTAAIMNVSVMGGFAYSDTAKNGLSIIVTGRGADRSSAEALAREVALFGWEQRSRFYAHLTPLDDAVQKAVQAGRDNSLPALCFADVADNPGGGGRGNTMYLLRAFAEAGVSGAYVGIIYDPDLAAEAHGHGQHYNFTAQFNRAETTKFSESWSAPARVAALSDGDCVGRRGIYAGQRLMLGKCAALAVGGIMVVVVSHRLQCADPIFFEMMGLDVRQARSVAVKSRGHFRGGFDEFFGPEQIVEVDLPGLTSPMLNRFEWTRLPRPVIPLDDGVEFRLT
jgi:microcystin degradation protein MlrC